MDSYTCRTIDRPVRATVTLPGSKSITNRALVAASLATGNSVLNNVLLAEDTELMITALRDLGLAISIDESQCRAEVSGCAGHLPASDGQLYCGNAGTVMRLCAAMCATSVGRFELDGSDRMRERPVGPLVDVLRQLGSGVEFLFEDGYPPLVMHAKGLRGGQVSFGRIESSQFVSAVLMAAPLASGDVLIDVAGPVPSKPYLDITTTVMEAFGVPVLAEFLEGDARFVVAAPQHYQATNFNIEPDASNASYFLAIPAVVGGSVTVKGLGRSSIQGDVRFVDVLEQMGCRIDCSESDLTVNGPDERQMLEGVDVDLNEMPDLAQTLAVISLFADGPTTIRNVANLRVKETDRIRALSAELTKLGAEVDERSDGLTIHPPKEPRGAAIETYNDHRMAMSFALAGLRIPGVSICAPQCCAKTFPDFFQRWDRVLNLATASD
jgi:3-phosphoshikimate 1-carboxyvinyltransferase